MQDETNDLKDLCEHLMKKSDKMSRPSKFDWVYPKYFSISINFIYYIYNISSLSAKKDPLSAENKVHNWREDIS